MPVTQPVENQGKQLTGRGDHTDVAPAAGADLITDLAKPVMLADALDGLHRSPADQGAALLSNPPAVHFGVGLVVFGSQPGPAAQLSGAREAMHITDLGDEHCT